MPERSSGSTTHGRAVNGACELYYETFGDPLDPALLLINGLGSQCINYQEAWCELFVAQHLHVIRFDNRDVGWSTSFAECPLDDHGAAYRISDMARDTIAVLDAVGVERSHVMGLSMGGMIVADARHRAPRPAALAHLRDVHNGRSRLRGGDTGGARSAARPTGDRPRVVRRRPHRRPTDLGQPGVRRRGPLACRRRTGLRPGVQPDGCDPTVDGRAASPPRAD